MANKYCILDGSNKIKDEYVKINKGFDRVESDVESIIIGQDLSPNKDIELLNARGREATLGNRLNKIEVSKADMDYIETQLSNIGSGSPKEVLPTLADLQSAYPNGAEGIYVISQNGNWYYWNGSLWTSGGVYQSTGISDNSITMEKIKGTVLSKNLFNLGTRELNKYIDPSANSIINSGSYDTSDYIPVTPGRSYTISFGRSIAFYDSNRTFVSAFSLGSTNPIVVITAQEVYIRVSFTKSNINIAQIEEGDTSTEYEPYKWVISNEMIGNNAIAIEKLKGLVAGKNKFNKNNIISGYLDPSTLQLTGSTYWASEYINVDVGRPYTCIGVRSIIEYSADLNPLKGMDLSPSDAITFIPENPIIRISVHPTYLENAQLEEGNNSTKYEPHKWVIPSEMVESADGGGGTTYDQSLNTTDDVQFNSVKTTGILPIGTLVVPPVGLVGGDVWADTTDSETHPILRVML